VNELQTAQRYLEYPEHWTDQSKDRYETLYALELVTQADIWAIEERLQWFRDWRDYFATTGGVDETARDMDASA
jgi:hypothetical protein